MQRLARFEQLILKRSIYVTIFIGLFGIIFGLISGSSAVVFDGLFSSTDAAMSILALFVARLLTSEGTKRFQHGFWHIEPLVLAFNGIVLILFCFYAFINAINTLMQGGHELKFDWAIIYAVIVCAMCFGMMIYQKRINLRLKSNFIALDTQSWLMTALITLALLIAFSFAWALQGTQYQKWTVYADPAILLVLSAGLIFVPMKTVAKAFSEILLVAPERMDLRVRAILDQMKQKHGFKKYASYVAKIGRARFIEIHIVLPANFPINSIATLDAIREEIAEEIGGAGPQRWITVSFTGDENWI
jgi:cation diffusion facilitator family transporter